MSDSGRQAGDCRHGKTPRWCCECLQDKLASAEAERDAAQKHARDHHLEPCETCIACETELHSVVDGVKHAIGELFGFDDGDERARGLRHHLMGTITRPDGLGAYMTALDESENRVANLESQLAESRAECAKASREILDLILAETNSTVEASEVNGTPFEILRRMIAERNSLRAECERLRTRPDLNLCRDVPEADKFNSEV